MSELFNPPMASTNGFVAAPEPKFTTYDGRPLTTDHSSRKMRLASSGSREDRAGLFPNYFNQKAQAAVVIDANRSRNGPRMDNFMTANPKLETNSNSSYKRLMTAASN